MCNVDRKVSSRARVGLLAFVLLCLTACASTPPPSSPPPPPPPPQAQEPPPEQSRTADSQSSSTDAEVPDQQATNEESGQQGGAETAGGQVDSNQSANNEGNQTEPQQGSASRQPGSLGNDEEQLEEDFQRSLSRFDKRLQRENAELDELTREQAEEEDIGGGSTQSEGEVFTSGSGAPFPPRGPQDSGVPGSPGDQARIPPPDDVGDGQDDDIVARQLREAAESETDPELREKLWEEYRAYKRNQ